MNALVVGGGIGGLAAALALHRRGWDVEVYERAPAITEVGAGLSLWPNAVRALTDLGLGDALRAGSAPTGDGGIRDRRGRWLTRTDARTLRQAFGDVVMIHRADLLDLLRRALPDRVLHTGVAVEAVTPDGVVRHAAGSARADLVVGADGLRSAVRAGLWPAVAPRYAGYTAWRFVTPSPVDLELGFETWGRGRRFGCARLRDGRVYCFAVVTAPEGAADPGLAGLRERFAGWHDPLPALLAAADEDALLHHDLYELPPLPSYVRGRVALLGDAAHAMTPDLGQGACQALEDAVALAACADRDGLAAYDARRRPRATMVTRRSARVGRVAQWRSPAAVALRDAVLRLTPESAFLRSLEPVLGQRRTV